MGGGSDEGHGLDGAKLHPDDALLPRGLGLCAADDGGDRAGGVGADTGTYDALVLGACRVGGGDGGAAPEVRGGKVSPLYSRHVLALPFDNMGAITVFVMSGLVATIPCQERSGPAMHLQVPK